MMIVFDIFTKFNPYPIIGILSFISAIVALYIAWKTYVLQKESDKNLKRMDKNINKIETNIQDLLKVSSEMKNNVNQTHFQIERTTAMNKYPERKEFKKINEAYLNFIFPLFDIDIADINVKINSNFSLSYKIEFIKNNIAIPKVKKSLNSSYYIIKIISPSHVEVLEENKLKKFQQSPIKEGEYYACWFSGVECSWFLSEELSWLADDKWSFYVSGFSPEAEWVTTANQVMGYSKNNDLGDD